MRTVVEQPSTYIAPRRTTVRAIPMLAGILAAYLVIAIAVGLTKIPICDEGWYADPALNLLHHGSMGSPVIESAGGFLKGIEQNTYWIMPMHILTQAAWYRGFGASLFSLRLLSAFAGLIALACWYFIVKTIAASRHLALIATCLAAADTSFLLLAGTGRSDMLSLAFGAAAQACYLALRERNLALASVLAHSLVVAGGLTHPIGGLVSFACVACLEWIFDRRRIGAGVLALVTFPYLAGAVAWGAYIVKAPAAFLAQFGGNSGERLWPWKAPLTALKRELVERYIGGYTMGSAWSHAADLRLLILATYLAAIVFTACNRNLRRSALGTVILAQAALVAAILLFFEGAKQPWYLVYFVFPFNAAVAISIQRLWTHQPRRKWIFAASAALLLLQIAYPALLIAQNKYRRVYLPAIAALPPCQGRCVMGTAELGFGLGFDRVLDDYRLGFFSSKRPEFMVLDPRYRSYIEQSRLERADIERYFTNLLSRDYRQIYDNGYYTIYTRREASE